MILKGSDIAQKKIPLLTQTVEHLNSLLSSPISLHIISVGNDPASQIYINMKKKKGNEIGIDVQIHKIEENSPQESFEELIKNLNQNNKVNGIIIQLPLPKHIDKEELLNSIHPLKDVDGLSAINQGHLLQNKPALIPCTPLGCLHLIKEIYPNLSGKTITIVGRSNLVGLPLLLLLTQQNATVTLCHSKTIEIKKHTLAADIIIIACGISHFLTKDMVSQDSCIIDVGISRLDNGKISGDADFENLQSYVKTITPVPGGVGPMTVLYLMHNTIKAAMLQNNIKHEMLFSQTI